MLTRFFSCHGLTAAQGWALLDWCASHGGDEFTIRGLIAGTESARMRDFFIDLAPYSLGLARRRWVDSTADQEVEVWRLGPETVSLLRRAFPAGFVSRVVQDDLWLEDLAVYRGGELMMGVDSNEGGGVLRVTADELRNLRTLDFPDRDDHPWVGY